jgi:hypothetical protein
MRALCSRPWSRSPLSVSVCLCLSLFASVCLRFPLPVCAFVCVNPSVAGRKVCGPSFVQVSFPDCLVVQAFTPHHYAREGLDRGERERERGPRVDDTRARVHRWTLCTRMCPTNFQSPWIDESQLFTRRRVGGAAGACIRRSRSRFLMQKHIIVCEQARMRSTSYNIQ